MTERQIEFSRHALGLPNKKSMTYRNHFCVGEGSDGYSEWDDLVAQGLAVKAAGGTEWCGDFFYLTMEGAKQVLLPKEHISREDAMRMRGGAA